MNGVIIVDKPAGWTSHDVVNRMRGILNQRSVGHLGTLDPLATGVLPLVVGNLTRLAQFYTASEKTYEGVIRLGFATTTYDADGDPVVSDKLPSQSDPLSSQPNSLSSRPGPLSSQPNSLSSRPEHAFAEGEGVRSGGTLRLISHPTLSQLQSLAARFVGVITQLPPPFSAKKIHGVPAYKLARKRKEVDLKPVQVEIKEFTITSLENNRAQFHARVASGTYMRSVAHDLGQRLGCGAHLESLRRTSVAEFDISQAHTLEEIQAAGDKTGCNSEPVRSAGEEPALRETKDNGPDPCHSERARANASASRRIPTAISEASGAGRVPHPTRSSSDGNLAGKNETTSRELLSLFIHPRQLLPQFPSVTADELTAVRIRNGRPVNLPELSRARHVKVFTSQTDLIAIATRVAGSLFHAKLVFPSG
jgi:tRNA pseudouridine55 synthase